MSLSIRHEIQQPHFAQGCPFHQPLWLVLYLVVFAPKERVFAGLEPGYYSGVQEVGSILGQLVQRLEWSG